MIYLLRHAETEWNFQLRKQGLDDSPLTDKGHRQAEAYGVALKHQLDMQQIDAADVQLYASPLGRTRATAQYLIDALSFDPQNVLLEPLLIEFDYGDWSGLTNAEIESRFPGELARRDTRKWTYTVPGGESYEDVESKVTRWFEQLPQDKTIVAVTHSVVSRVIRGKYLDLPRAEAGMLEHLQDKIFKLQDQQIEEIDVFAGKVTAAATV